MAIGQEQSLEQQLFSALEHHNAGALAGLLLAGADANAKNELGQTAIEYAFQAKCPDEMRVMLLEGGADIGPVVEWIAWAAELAPAEVLKRFLTAGADPNLPSADGRPLQIATRLGRQDAVELLLRAGADPDAGTEAGNPLAEAIAHGHSHCAISLLAGGARPEKADRTRPALGTAALKGMTDVVRAMVAAGADVNAKVTLLQDHGVLDELSRAFDEVFREPDSAPPTAPAKKTPPTVLYANATPLVIAAAEGHEDTVRCLVERGADLEAADDTHRTAFQWAEAKGHTSVVLALLDAGANPKPALPPALAATRGDHTAPEAAGPDQVTEAPKIPTTRKKAGKKARKAAKTKAKKKTAGRRKTAKKKTAKKAKKKTTGRRKAAKKKTAKKAKKKTTGRRKTAKKKTAKKAKKKTTGRRKTAKKRAKRKTAKKKSRSR